MIQASFTIRLSDFTPDIIEKLKEFFKGHAGDAEVYVRVKPTQSAMLRTETREEYFRRLEKSLADGRSNHNLTTFDSFDELEAYFQN